MGFIPKILQFATVNIFLGIYPSNESYKLELNEYINFSRLKILSRLNSSGTPDVLLPRLPGFIQEFSASPILPDFLYELEPNLALKFPDPQSEQILSF